MQAGHRLDHPHEVDPVHPSAYLLAVRNGRVTGEILWADGHRIPPWVLPQGQGSKPRVPDAVSPGTLSF